MHSMYSTKVNKIKYIIDFSRVRNAQLAKNVVYAVFNLCENAATRGWRNRITMPTTLLSIL